MKLLTAVFSILFFCFTLNVGAQNAPVVTFETVSTSESTVVVSVTVDNFTGIKACDLKILYNQPVAKPMGVTKGTALGGTVNVNISTPGKIKIGWYAGTGVTMANGSAIFNITFNKLNYGILNLEFDFTDDYDCQFYNSTNQKLNDQPTNSFFIPASVTIFNDTECPITSAPTITAAINDTIDIPITVSDFYNIGNISLTLKYDSLALSYNSATNTGGFPDLKIKNPKPGIINVSGNTNNPAGYSLVNNSVLFTLNCTYLGGTTALSWHDEGTSCEYKSRFPDYNVLKDSLQSAFYIDGQVSSSQSTPLILAGTPTNPVTCGGNGIIPITFTNVPDGTYTIFYNSGSFSNIAVSASAATIGAPAGTYNNLQITLNGVTSAEGVNTVLTDPEKPAVPAITVGGPTTFCQGGSVVLNTDEASAYLWSSGETTQSITVSTSGNYSVNVTNTAGCSATSEVMVVTVNAKPEQPAQVNCWDDFKFNESLCAWENKGTAPLKPEQENCWDNFVFNTISCLWDNTGTQPTEPKPENCWDEFTFNTNSCSWENTGTAPLIPEKKNCWDNFVFNNTTCFWDNTGTLPTEPTLVNCWDEFTFNTNSCSWENSGVEPEKPVAANCWDEYKFNESNCVWENKGIAPKKPEKKNCWDEFTFYNNTCQWENIGVQQEKPAMVNCWDNFVFTEATCSWVNFGAKPLEPARLKSWDEFIFNPVSCTWENIGVATGLEMYGNADKMTLTCYPNPMNDKSTIKYLLPENGQVNIEGTGILGNRINLINNRKQFAGEYVLELDGEQLAAGIYQITLRLTDINGRDWSKTIRMIKQ